LFVVDKWWIFSVLVGIDDYWLIPRGAFCLMLLLVFFLLFAFELLYLLITKGIRILSFGADVLKNQLATEVEVFLAHVVFENCVY
jgi:hypothetical protein